MEHILPWAAEYDMLPPDGLLLCALSGGGDSTALVHYLHAQGFRVAAAHFDHRLRPDSGQDAAAARALCESLGVPFYLGCGDLLNLPGNVEENARNARYAFLEETAERIGAVRILTAHTSDDNLETVLLHLTRGCGLRGLCGIQPRRGKLCRPMLRTSHAAVEGYLKEHSLPYATDPTNLDDSYARNRIRHRVTPVLQSLNPQVTEAVGRMTASLREDSDYLEAQAAAVREEENPRRLHPALRHRLPPPSAYPPLTPTVLSEGSKAVTPLWTVELDRLSRLPDTSGTPDCFYLDPDRLPGVLTLRSRRTGDFLHPPNRVGKSLKKWFIELGVPQAQREALPVLCCGDTAVAAPLIGPHRDYIATGPGRPCLRVVFTKTTEREE